MKNTNKTKKKAKKNLMISGERRIIAGTIAKILLPGTGIGTYLTTRGWAMVATDLVVNKTDRAIWTAVHGTMFEKMPGLAESAAAKYEGVDEFLTDYYGGYNTEEN